MKPSQLRVNPMQTSRETIQSPPPPSRFREQEASADEHIEQANVQPHLPFEVHMTDEPGGDPYNHTGRFRRNFR